MTFRVLTHPVDADHSPSPLPNLAIRGKQACGQQDGSYYSHNYHGDLIASFIDWLPFSSQRVLLAGYHPGGRGIPHSQSENQGSFHACKHSGHHHRNQ